MDSEVELRPAPRLERPGSGWRPFKPGSPEIEPVTPAAAEARNSPCPDCGAHRKTKYTEGEVYAWGCKFRDHPKTVYVPVVRR